jgi:hypothetical protein
VKHWEIIPDNLSKAGWSWGSVSAVDSNGRTIFIADAHRNGGKRFVVRADETLTAFLELEAVIHRNREPSTCDCRTVKALSQCIGTATRNVNAGYPVLARHPLPSRVEVAAAGRLNMPSRFAPPL